MVYLSTRTESDLIRFLLPIFKNLIMHKHLEIKDGKIEFKINIKNHPFYASYNLSENTQTNNTN